MHDVITAILHKLNGPILDQEYKFYQKKRRNMDVLE